MQPDPNFEVFNEEIEIKLKEIGHFIGDTLPEGWGFTLLLFSFGEGGSTFYISNAERASMIEAMKEFIKKNEGGK
jgi:hypothetical protein